MKRTSLLVIVLIFLSFVSTAQLKIAFVGGAQQSKILEENEIPGWDTTTKQYYSERTAAHFGFIADLPFSAHSHFSFQPGVIYYNKGRKYAQNFDTLTSIVFSKSSTQYLNYVDIPLNVVARFGKKIKFVVGGGPYASLFFNGKETTKTISKGNVFHSEEDNDPPVGNKPGQYQIFNYGVNALAGVEYGRVFLTANYSRGLNDFYQAATYNGSFKHQVIGVTLGIYLGKPVEMGDQ